jgi:hypothetical protein
VQAGALSKLWTLQFSGCNSLKTLPLSLKLLTSLKNLILDECPEKLEDFCIENYEQTAIWHLHWYGDVTDRWKKLKLIQLTHEK